MINTIIRDRVYSLKVELEKKYNVDYVNIYFLVEENLLIDIGPDHASFIAVEEFLMNFNTNISQLNGIIITHSHADHCGAINFIPKSTLIYYEEDLALKSLSDLNVNFLGEKESAINNHINTLHSYNAALKHRAATETLKYISSNVELISLSGHSNCDLCIKIKDLDIVFCGDLLVSKSLIDSHYTNNDNLKVEYFNSLEILYNCNAKIYLPSHEGTLNHEEVANVIMKKLEKNRKALLKFSSKLGQSKEIFEAIDNAYPLIERISVYFTYSESILFLRLLQEVGIFEKNQKFVLKDNYCVLINEYFDQKKEYYE